MRQLALLLLAAVCACARPSTEAQNDSPLPSASAAPAPPLPSSPEPSTALSPPVLTPEDAEEDAAHRITEQNLESELDRLEREIQAE
ncbi:MAG: hypothetical protein K0R38_3458 [Polyangiaceae bacterium]|jgi:hypothetical protein|nr:hypothetical protein [Polyangiaceae bacterium]